MEDWKYLKATEYCYNVTDGTHDSPKQSKDGKYLITSKYIKENRIDFDNAYRISLSDYTKIIERSRVDQWDIIISMIGAYCGYCYLETSTKTDYAIKNVGLFKVGNELKSRWLYYYLTSPQGKQQLAMLRTGSSQPYISLNSLRNIIIPTPGQNEMGRIVNILKFLDDKIELNRRINRNLEQQTQALFKAWFVDFEPFKNGKFVDSELGKIPEEWKIGHFTDIVKVSGGGTPKTNNPLFWNGSIPFFTPKDASDNVFTYETEKHITDLGVSNCNSPIYPAYTVFITARGTIGKIRMAGKPMAMNQSCYALLTTKEKLEPYVYLLSLRLVNIIRKKANGAVFEAITTKDFEENIVIPPNEILTSFIQLVNPLFFQIHHNGLENQNLIILRDTLLPKLMSGELNVNTITE